MDLVSAVIPTYEREELLIRALRSIKNQTYKNIEIIVVDDSKKEKEESFFKEFKNVTYIHSSIKRGAQRARNIGVHNTKGRYVAMLDDDDEWEPTKIEKQLKEIDEDKHAICITYSHDLRFHQDRINKPKKIVTHEDLIKSFNLSSTSTYLIPKKHLEKICKKDGYYFDESLVNAHEYDLAIRLTACGLSVITVEETLVTQNAPKGQISENWKNKVTGLMQLYHKHHKEYSFKDHIKSIGVMGLFTFAFLLRKRGYLVYKILIPAKEVYENV